MPTLISIEENETNFSFASNDRIFLGEGLFETLRVARKKPCYPEEHWQRLKKAAFFLGLSFDLPFEIWLEKLNQCIQLKKLHEGGIKAILGGGSAPRGLLARSNETNLVLNAFQYCRSSQPLALISASWLRDAKNPIYQLKSINYLESIIARRQAEVVGADDVLFFNFQRHATETSIANFFLIKNNCLVTPPLHSGVLPGILRGRLLSLCKEQGIPCLEDELPQDCLKQAEAAFTCNALQGIRPVRSLDNHCFNVNHPIFASINAILAQDGS